MMDNISDLVSWLKENTLEGDEVALQMIVAGPHRDTTVGTWGIDADALIVALGGKVRSVGDGE